MEEAVGFEPTVPAKVRQFSRLYQSTTLTRFQLVRMGDFETPAYRLSTDCSASELHAQIDNFYSD